MNPSEEALRQIAELLKPIRGIEKDKGNPSLYHLLFGNPNMKTDFDYALRNAFPEITRIIDDALKDERADDWLKKELEPCEVWLPRWDYNYNNKCDRCGKVPEEHEAHKRYMEHAGDADE